MKKKLRIGVDMDGVIANWGRGALEVISKTWPQLDITSFPDIKTGDLIKHKLKKLGTDVSKKEIYKTLCPKGFFRNLEPYPNVYETLKYLSEVGDIYIVTKPIEFEYTPFEKSEWLKEHLKDIEYRIIFTQTSEAKGLLDLDLMIDDDPRVFYSSKEETFFFIPCQTWNKEFQEKEKNNNRVCFVNSLNEIVEKIEEVR